MSFDLDSFSLPAVFTVFHFLSIDSTSRFLKDEVKKGKLIGPTFCIAEEQTSGYGQRGRSWESDDKQSSLTSSFAFPFNYSLNDLLLKSVPVALIIRELLAKYSNQEFQVKWPNDIYFEGKKVAGCLLEVIHSKERNKRFVIFGLGVNLEAQSDLKYGYVEGLSVNDFLVDLAEVLHSFFMNVDFKLENVHKEWQKHDYFTIGESVRVYDSDTFLNGIYQGINSSFQPVVLIDGKSTAFSSGQASIRKI